jgi:4-diphosphocytidyl-2-C-methyl-D-erythritol kinase
MAVERLARAKLNLALHVTGQRADGYHLLDSLVVFADLGDAIAVEPAAGLGLSIDGPMAAGLSAGEDNLVLRAARLLGPGRGAAIRLTKRLPVASGIGGGSADAAATLSALAELWGVALPDADRVLTLGADVPVCLAGRPARMQGIGEVVTPLAAPLPPAAVLLVNPGVAVSTPEIFRRLRRKDNAPLPASLPGFASLAHLADFLSAQRNDLQPPAEALAPVIGTVIAALAAEPGARIARMSGSGATCFALFDRIEEARAAAARLKADQAGWWVQAGMLSR